MVAELHALREDLWPAVFQRPDSGEPVDVDEDLYGGFVGQEDRRTLDRLRALPPERLAQTRPLFADPRLPELLLRYKARNFPDTLAADEQATWAAHCASRWQDDRPSSPGMAAYFERLDALNETADERGEAILGELYDWAGELAPELGQSEPSSA